MTFHFSFSIHLWMSAKSGEHGDVVKGGDIWDLWRQLQGVFCWLWGDTVHPTSKGKKDGKSHGLRAPKKKKKYSLFSLTFQATSVRNWCTKRSWDTKNSGLVLLQFKLYAGGIPFTTVGTFLIYTGRKVKPLALNKEMVSDQPYQWRLLKIWEKSQLPYQHTSRMPSNHGYQPHVRKKTYQMCWAVSLGWL